MALEALPNELLLQVLASVDDLTTLNSLLRASPASYRLFDNGICAIDIFESILSTGCVCNHVQILMRQVALLRSGSQPFPPGYAEYTSWSVPPGVASFRRQVIEESLRHSSRQRASAMGFAPSRLHRDVMPAVLRSLLVTARRITAVSLGCVAFYLEGLERYAAEEAQMKSNFSFPPVWTEEQRCTRTLWRLQLIFDLKQAARNGTLGWSERELKSLDNIAAIGPPEGDSLLGLQANNSSQHWLAAGCGKRFFYHSAAHHDCYYPGVSHPEKHEHVTVMECIRHLYGPDLALCVNQGLLSPSALTERREVHRQVLAPAPLPEDHKQLLYASAAIQHYEIIQPRSSTSAERGGCPVFPDITLLRRAGFALWSNQRLLALNDLPSPCGHTQSVDKMNKVQN